MVYDAIVQLEKCSQASSLKGSLCNKKECDQMVIKVQYGKKIHRARAPHQKYPGNLRFGSHKS
jgi:hypothetical protein